MKNIFANGLRDLKSAFASGEYIIKTERTADGVDGRIVAYCDEHSHVAEQYRMIRTNLAYLSPENPVKSILITSAQAREGKSLTACNIAMALAQDATRKTVLIDADFRRASIHTIFGISKTPGFSDIITGEAQLDTLVVKPRVGNLYIIPTGGSKQNPSELLVSTRVKGIIDSLKKQFDYIIFDTPPVLHFTSASELGSLCDAVVLIVKSGTTQKHFIREAFISLQEAGAKPKAAILTGTAHRFSYSYYYHT